MTSVDSMIKFPDRWKCIAISIYLYIYHDIILTYLKPRVKVIYIFPPDNIKIIYVTGIIHEHATCATTSTVPHEMSKAVIECCAYLAKCFSRVNPPYSSWAQYKCVQ